MNDEDIAYADVVDLQALLTSKAISSVELCLLYTSLTSAKSTAGFCE